MEPLIKPEFPYFHSDGVIAKMKLASIRYEDKDRVVVRFDDRYALSLETLLTSAKPKYAGLAWQNMMSVIRGGPLLLDDINAALAHFKQAPDTTHLIPLSDVGWHPPVRNPGKICGIAMNNSASNERKIRAPDHPAFFLKPASCLIGHKQPIKIRPYYGSVHPEPELAVIIGKESRNIAAVEALDAVVGYSIFNDVTSNTMRAEDLFHYWAVYAKKDQPSETERIEQHLSYAGRYKGSDTFGSLGPWLVTKDDVEQPDDLTVRCRMGNDIVAEDSTRYYNFKVAEIISFISQFQTLQPGDIIACGTAFKPSANRKSIHSANFQIIAGPVAVTIEGLGTLENPVVIEDKEIGQWRLIPAD